MIKYFLFFIIADLLWLSCQSAPPLQLLPTLSLFFVFECKESGYKKRLLYYLIFFHIYFFVGIIVSENMRYEKLKTKRIEYFHNEILKRE